MCGSPLAPPLVVVVVVEVVVPDDGSSPGVVVVVVVVVVEVVEVVHGPQSMPVGDTTLSVQQTLGVQVCGTSPGHEPSSQTGSLLLAVPESSIAIG